MSVLTAVNENADCWNKEAEDAQTTSGTKESQQWGEGSRVGSYGHCPGPNGAGKQDLT